MAGDRGRRAEQGLAGAATVGEEIDGETVGGDLNRDPFAIIEDDFAESFFAIVAIGEERRHRRHQDEKAGGAL